MTPTLILCAYLLLLGIATATARAADPPKAPVMSGLIVATWTCQDHLGQPRSFARSPWKPHSAGYWAWQKNLWTSKLANCRQHLHGRADALRTGRYDQLPDSDLYALADQAVASGAIYSVRWGDASPTLRGLCYEAVRRAFKRYGTDGWARYVVNRESGCNPGAVNTTYSDPGEQATCIAQMIPSIHDWIDYSRCKRDLRYAVQVFVRLSRGGSSTGPWA